MSLPSRSDAETLFRASEIFEDLGDTRSAFKCVAISAKLNHAPSQLNVGNMYASGVGTKKDLRLAAYWYMKAYRNGDASGAFNLAIDKRNQGDRRSAIAWFRKAAAQNHGAAFIELAKLYKERSATRQRAVDLLEQALRLSRDDIGDDSKQEAEALLREVGALSGGHLGHPSTP